MTNVTEEVPRTIAASRGWVKHYTICAALVKNPKTPLGISMNLLPRLNDRDMKAISTDRKNAGTSDTLPRSLNRSPRPSSACRRSNSSRCSPSPSPCLPRRRPPRRT